MNYIAWHLSVKRRLKILMSAMHSNSYHIRDGMGDSVKIYKQDVNFWINHWEGYSPVSHQEIMLRCNQIWRQIHNDHI